MAFLYQRSWTAMPWTPCAERAAILWVQPDAAAPTKRFCPPLSLQNLDRRLRVSITMAGFHSRGRDGTTMLACRQELPRKRFPEPTNAIGTYPSHQAERRRADAPRRPERERRRGCRVARGNRTRNGGIAGSRRSANPTAGVDLVDHDRIRRRPGGADHAERRPDERALEDFLVDKGLGGHVFRVPHSPTGRHPGGTGHGEVRTLLARGLRIAGGGVAHGQRDVARGHVFARADTEARLALAEEVAGRLPLVGIHRLVAVVAPAITLPRMKRLRSRRRRFP